MTHLTLSNLSKQFPGITVVQDFNLDVKKGEFVSFLGPSGCGKTTTLRMIAGFEVPTTGKVTLDDADITDRAPNQRNVGMVFQAYALFPNMTVAQNIGFGLRVRKESRAHHLKSGWPKCSRSSILNRKGTVIPINFQAANNSAWPWPGPWPIAPKYYCWMSRYRRWMPRFAFPARRNPVNSTGVGDYSHIRHT